MVDPAPHRPLRSVGEVLGTGRLPRDFVEALSVRFRITREEAGPLSTEEKSIRGVHSFLAHFTSRVDLVPGFERVALMQVYLDRKVHLLHLLFSVPVGPYSTVWWLFACG